MNFFYSFDRELYAIAALEISSEAIDPGLRAKAFADSNGSEPQAQALYLRMRVVELIAQRAALQHQIQEEASRLQHLRDEAARKEEQVLLAAVAERAAQQEQARIAAIPKAVPWREQHWATKFVVIVLVASGVGLLAMLIAFSIPR